jgi:hypothetical protein
MEHDGDTNTGVKRPRDSPLVDPDTAREHKENEVRVKQRQENKHPHKFGPDTKENCRPRKCKV